MTDIEKNKWDDLYSSLDMFLNPSKNTEWQHSILLSYEKSVVMVCEKADIASIPYLVRIIQISLEIRKYLNQHTLWVCLYYERNAMRAANTLVSLATSQPSRELLPALEILRSGFARPNAPLEFIPLRIRLARALKRCNNLPIPASRPLSESQDLPRPTQNSLSNSEQSNDSK